MKITLTTPAELTEGTIEQLCAVAQAGFGRLGDTAMDEDTKRHIAGAESLHIAQDRGRPIALSMYRSCLWR